MIYRYSLLFLLGGILIAQDLTPEEILSYVVSHPKPESSITEIRLEITRKKKKKKKVKVREFTRYEKVYESGKFISKSLARFHKPKIVKGTSFLSWVYRNGKTDQWFALPKIKKAKKVKAKDKSKSFLNTDFTYEDLENRGLGVDSLVSLGSEYIDGNMCKVMMAWPKEKSSYFSRKIWVNTQTWRIAKVEYYTSESKKEKTLYVSDFIKKDGFSIAGKMVMEKENGNKTVMEVMSYKPDIGLKDEVFTKDFLVKKQN